MEKYWQVFKTLVYCIGYTGACYVIGIWNYNSWVINEWLGQPGFATLSFVTLIATWFIWTIGIVGILFEGMTIIRKVDDNHGQEANHSTGSDNEHRSSYGGP